MGERVIRHIFAAMQSVLFIAAMQSVLLIAVYLAIYAQTPDIKVPKFDASKLTTASPIITSDSGAWLKPTPYLNGETLTWTDALTFTNGNLRWLTIYPGDDSKTYEPKNTRIVSTKEPVVVKKGTQWVIAFKP
jgi:hypothetical protein